MQDAPPPVHPHLQAAAIAMKALTVLTVGAALLWLVSNIRQISPDKTAVVFRFGAIARLADAGLLLALPEPFERVELLPSPATVLDQEITALTRSEAAGFQENPGLGADDALAGSGFLLTGDASVVQLKVHVYYKISDPGAYVLQRPHIPQLLDRIVARSAVTVAAGRDLDSILVARPELTGPNTDASLRREQLKTDLLGVINERLQKLAGLGAEPGIRVDRVDLQSGLPGPATDAFEAVLTASQAAEAQIAAARNAAEQTRQAAAQSADSILKAATAGSAERVAQAKSNTADILGLTSANREHGDPATVVRLYRERINRVLAAAGKVIAVDGHDQSHIILQGERQ